MYLAPTRGVLFIDINHASLSVYIGNCALGTIIFKAILLLSAVQRILTYCAIFSYLCAPRNYQYWIYRPPAKVIKQILKMHFVS